MKLRNGLIAVTLGLAIAGGSAVSGHAAQPREERITAAAPADRGAVAFTSPTPQSRVNDKFPTFQGTGRAGASVVVTDRTGIVLCAARVSAEGWSCSSVVPMGDGPTTAVATQDAWSVKSVASVSFGVQYVDRPAVPLWLFIVGGGGVTALVAAISLALVVRGRKKRAKAVTAS